MSDETCGGFEEGGHCVCPRCSHQIDHGRGIPCQEENCPVCGTKMLGEGVGPQDHLLDVLKEKPKKDN